VKLVYLICRVIQGSVGVLIGYGVGVRNRGPGTALRSELMHVHLMTQFLCLALAALWMVIFKPLM